VPLIIRWPGTVKPGTISREPVTSIDYLPTICEIAGLKPPDDRHIDGLSLVEHLKSNGAATLARDAIFWHFPHYRDEIVPYSLELFNLENDLSEKNDLARKMPEKVEQLDAKLTAWLKATGARLPRPPAGNKPRENETDV